MEEEEVIGQGTQSDTLTVESSRTFSARRPAGPSRSSDLEGKGRLWTQFAAACRSAAPKAARSLRSATAACPRDVGRRRQRRGRLACEVARRPGAGQTVGIGFRFFAILLPPPLRYPCLYEPEHIARASESWPRRDVLAAEVLVRLDCCRPLRQLLTAHIRFVQPASDPLEEVVARPVKLAPGAAAPGLAARHPLRVDRSPQHLG